jgi:hypothetical protein
LRNSEAVLFCCFQVDDERVRALVFSLALNLPITIKDPGHVAAKPPATQPTRALPDLGKVLQALQTLATDSDDPSPLSQLEAGNPTCRREIKLMATFTFLLSLLLIFVVDANKSAEAAKFFCSSGDVTCLIAAINAANGKPGKHIINLDPGIYTIQAPSDRFNGLPSISGSIRIKAISDTDPTVIERDPDALPFRIFQVALGGELVLDGLVIQRGGSNRGGSNELPIFAAAILNHGSTTLRNSTITDTIAEGGTIANSGTLNVVRSIIANNFGGHDAGAIVNGDSSGTPGIF